MPIADAANINSSGVLISSTNLNTLRLSDDNQTMSIGPGPRWGDVFEYMDGTNLTVVGGRLAPVGVPGLLLGGGISHYSYKHGLGSANGKIKAYEVLFPASERSSVTNASRLSSQTEPSRWSQAITSTQTFIGLFKGAGILLPS